MSGIEYILVMNFECANREKVSMSVTGVEQNLTGTQIGALMNTILEKNIFDTKYGDLAAKKDAFITEKLVRELNITV